MMKTMGMDSAMMTSREKANNQMRKTRRNRRRLVTVGKIW